MFKRLMGFPFPLALQASLSFLDKYAVNYSVAPLTTSSGSTGLMTAHVPSRPALGTARCFFPKASIREQGHLFPDRFDRGGRFGKVGIGQTKEVPWDFWFICSRYIYYWWFSSRHSCCAWQCAEHTLASEPTLILFSPTDGRYLKTVSVNRNEGIAQYNEAE